MPKPPYSYSYRGLFTQPPHCEAYLDPSKRAWLFTTTVWFRLFNSQRSHTGEVYVYVEKLQVASIAIAEERPLEQAGTDRNVIRTGTLIGIPIKAWTQPSTGPEFCQKIKPRDDQLIVRSHLILSMYQRWGKWLPKGRVLFSLAQTSLTKKNTKSWKQIALMHLFVAKSFQQLIHSSRSVII